eukprot:TRINITY_DN1216_c0_g1_i2.p1 TRINITY_DN1216_c0_g1~~TRINITY_DN1216_c0_g1_i2.p1  ORF type:complete len:379 (-),score=23.40 TRINITY_DN1216_c0_g1_i2:2624-3760(-)
MTKFIQIFVTVVVGHIFIVSYPLQPSFISTSSALFCFSSQAFLFESFCFFLLLLQNKQYIIGYLVAYTMSQTLGQTVQSCSKPTDLRQRIQEFRTTPQSRGVKRQRVLKCMNQTVTDDWREFRARIIEQHDSKIGVGRTRSGGWAHSLSQVERGCILLSSPHSSWYQDGRNWQSVVLLLSFDNVHGSLGIVLNKPSALVIGKEAERSLYHAFYNTNRMLQTMVEQGQSEERRRRGQGTSTVNATPQVVNEILQVLTPEECDTFRNHRVYCGGQSQPGELNVIHGCTELGVSSSFEICPGVYLGNQDIVHSAIQLIKNGQLQQNEISLYSGVKKWGVGELEFELGLGLWKPVACCKDLILSKDKFSLYKTLVSLLGSTS